MELFEEIRREYEFGGGTIAGVARKLGIHRRMVRDALEKAVPPARKKVERARPKLGPFVALIEGMLEADRQAPRKQRHTAHRIWQRLKEERTDFDVGERMIRRYVRERKLALGMMGREVCVPQSYPWGREAQVDWYEAYADLAGERTRLDVFEMRSMASGGAFHRAYLRPTQQAFLEAHELAFARFGGVFECLRYDNLKSAVKRILQGHRREETARFVAFRSHWRFRSEFCNPGVAHAHEKGGIEGEAGYFRRNHWVPVPEAGNLEELNEQLPAACYGDEARTISGRQMTVGRAMAAERPHLLPLAEEGFDLAEVSFPVVDGLGRVQVRCNWYSAPVQAGLEVEARIYPSCVEIRHEGRLVARHERCYGRMQEILDLEHYLEPLERKPGALAASKPLEQWRRRGRRPGCYDRMWQQLISREGRHGGTRQMIELLRLGERHGYDALRQAIEAALAMGSCEVATVRYLMTAEQLDRAAAPPLDVGALVCYERPLPVMSDYDQLLDAQEVAS